MVLVMGTYNNTARLQRIEQGRIITEWIRRPYCLRCFKNTEL